MPRVRVSPPSSFRERRVANQEFGSNINNNISEDDIQQATELVYFLAAMSSEEEVEDIISDLRKQRINPMKLIERFEKAQEEMADLSSEEMYALWGNKPKSTSQPARRAVRRAVKPS